MKTLVFSTRASTKDTFTEANPAFGHELTYTETRLAPETAALAKGYPAVCIFVNDMADATVLDTLAASGVKLIALRAAASITSTSRTPTNSASAYAACRPTAPMPWPNTPSPSC